MSSMFYLVPPLVVVEAHFLFGESHGPLSVGGKNTQRIHVRIERDIDAHCEHARAAGAKIVMEPADQFYGERTYIAEDLEGHHWTFSQPVKQVSRQEMEE